MRSGVLKVAAFNPSSAFSASSTEKPRSSKPARRNRLIFGSSSIRSTALLGLFICGSRQLERFHRRGGQGDGSRCSVFLPAARDVDSAAVCPDKNRGDPKAQARAGDCCLMAPASERSAAQELLFVRRDPDALIGNRQNDAPWVGSRGA